MERSSWGGHWQTRNDIDNDGWDLEGYGAACASRSTGMGAGEVRLAHRRRYLRESPAAPCRPVLSPPVAPTWRLWTRGAMTWRKPAVFCRSHTCEFAILRSSQRTTHLRRGLERDQHDMQFGEISIRGQGAPYLGWWVAAKRSLRSRDVLASLTPTSRRRISPRHIDIARWFRSGKCSRDFHNQLALF